MLVLISTLYILHTSGVFAAPITNSTAPISNSTALHHDVAPGWVSGPKTRGTWQILYSCVFTLLLCVYTAIHLNVPAKSDTALRLWLRKLKWASVAILAPEIVVYAAFEQWYCARKFLKDLNDIASASDDEQFKKWYDRDTRHPPFNMAYAHYALMGGFAGDVEDIHNILERVTLAPDGILFLARHGYFCCLDPGDIEDKSKADYLAKGLVCVQVVWIIGQAIERKIANLPISLLEAHTIVHVVCALVMYAIWYQKPLNVICPTVLDFGEHRDLFAFLLQTTAARCGRKYDVLSPRHGMYKYSATMLGSHSNFNSGFLKQPSSMIPRKLEPDVYFCRPNDLITDPNTMTSSYDSILQHSMGSRDTFVPAGTGSMSYTDFVPSRGESCCTLLSGQCLQSHVGFFDKLSTGRGPIQMGRCKVSLTSKDIKRLQLVGRAWQRLEPSLVGTGAISDSPNKHLITLDEKMSDALGIGQPLEHRRPNVSSDVYDTATSGEFFLLGIALAVIPSAYAAVHLPALNLLFSTAIERLLWKVSCYVLIAVACFCYISLSLAALVSELDDAIRNRRSGFLYNWWPKRTIVKHVMIWYGYGMICVTLLGILVYMAARVFLVVESFISLRHVPIGVYQVPDLNFMGNIPHL